MGRRLLNGNEKRYANMPDITRIEDGKSVSLRVEGLLKIADKYVNDPEALKKEFYKILDDPTTHVSKMKAMKYKEDISQMYTFKRISGFLTNLYMRGAKLGLS